MKRNLQRTAFCILAHLASAQEVFAGSTQGSAALAMAALVGSHSPLLHSEEKKILARLLNGSLAFNFLANKKITIAADAVSCRSGNVDISAHSCDLTFGPRKITLKGREAHELYATLAVVSFLTEGDHGTTVGNVGEPNG